MRVKMRMSAVGLRAADASYKHMRAVLTACVAAHVDPPAEVRDYFVRNFPEGAFPIEGEQGTVFEVSLAGCRREWSSDYSQGYDVDVARVPQGIEVVRFSCSW